MMVLDLAPVVVPTALPQLASWALHQELLTWPKPGLVSPADNGAHPDMDFALFEDSIASLSDYFAAIHVAGRQRAPLAHLRTLGITAEKKMLKVTRGINTHRGAIFSVGLLLAAAGRREADLLWQGRSLGEIVSELWGAELKAVPRGAPLSNGLKVARQYGVGGARGEAASGFPSLYKVGLPALRAARYVGWRAGRVQCFFALVAQMEDTNVLHRAGADGLRFAQSQTQAFLHAGGVWQLDWVAVAWAIHQSFVERRLSPGGAGDLLAATILVDVLDADFQAE